MRSLLIGVAALACAVALSGCGIPKAAHVEVQVLDNRIVLLKPTSGVIRSGETVLKIDNYAQHPVNMILAKTPLPASKLPKSLVDAVSARDDNRIVSMTSTVKKVGVTFAYGAIPNPSPRVVSLHVYLEPGKRYLLFDKLGGYKQGISIALQPKR